MIVKINFRTAILFLLLISFLEYRCKKENENEKTVIEVVNPPRAKSGAENYVSLIRKNTLLISKVVLDTTFTPYTGIEETQVNYINSNKEPMAVYFLTVDLTKSNLSMEVATPFDMPEFTRQTVRDMITYKNSISSSWQVIGAVNGDNWDVSTPPTIPDGTPLGLVYKNGAMIKELPDKNYYFLALLKDKTAVIGDVLKYQSVRNNIKEALGGRYFLVNNGVNAAGKLGTDVEPRTSVGVLNPQKVVFVVVDGRRSGYSAGISMQDLAKLFVAIGAYDAINMDGGGSTTYILKNNEGKYQTINKPSDNSERPVANAWTVMWQQ